jgi:hypothetical protein
MGITKQRARADVLLAGLALACALGLLVTPPSASLVLPLLVVARCLAFAWMLVRLLVLDRTLRRWRAWRENVAWSITPAALERYHG